MQIALPVAEPHTTIPDADNKVTQFFYNAQGLLTEMRDALYPVHPAITFTYNTLAGSSPRPIRSTGPPP